MKLNSDFDKLGFHDTSIEKVERQPEVDILEIKGIFISKEYPNSYGQDWRAEYARLEIWVNSSVRHSYSAGNVKL